MTHAVHCSRPCVSWARPSLQVSKKSPNDNFVEDFKRKFPDLETPILIACSDGRTYSIDALEQCVNKSHIGSFVSQASLDAYAGTSGAEAAHT